MASFAVKTLCGAHQWNPGVTSGLFNTLSSFLPAVPLNSTELSFAVKALCETHHSDPQLTNSIIDKLSSVQGSSSHSSASSFAATLLLGVGLLAIADVLTAARKTALNGDASLLDTLLICAGQHKDQNAPRLSNGEYPACAAMTTGHVFRVENEATTYFLQRVGQSGQLTTLSVESAGTNHFNASGVIEVLCASLTLFTMSRLVAIGDWTASIALGVYILVRLVNSTIIRRRAVVGWAGKKEAGVQCDLFVLLSQDRWVRLKGLTDDIKIITSGAWLRQSTSLEYVLTAVTTMFLYLNVGVVAGASKEGQAWLLFLIVVTTVLVEVTNASNDQLKMHGRHISFVKREKFDQRLDMARKLVRETGNDEWCEKMGIVLTKQTSAGRSTGAAFM